eukprot:1123678-Amorphochlora_amoeboformis.AAC.1
MRGIRGLGRIGGRGRRPGAEGGEDGGAWEPSIGCVEWPWPMLPVAYEWLLLLDRRKADRFF